MKYFAALTLLTLLCILSLDTVWNRIAGLQNDSNGLRHWVYTASALTLISATHLVAMMTVRAQQKLIGKPPIFGNYAEWFVPPIIWITWGFISIRMDAATAGFAFGGMVALCLAVPYTLVRAMPKIGQAATTLAAPNPSPKFPQTQKQTTRYVYLLRIAAAAWSYICACAVVFTLFFPNTPYGLWAILPLICILICTIFIFSLGVQQLLRQARDDRRTASIEITKEELRISPASVALHCSGAPTAKHVRIRKLHTALTRENYTTAVIARDKNAFQKAKSLRSGHIWYAPQTDALNILARPSIEAVFYTHDALKNGAFVRFANYVHILDATTGNLAQLKDIPQSLRMYDCVIAPNTMTAYRWQKQLSDHERGLVVLHDEAPELLHVSSTQTDTPVVGVHLEPDSCTGTMDAAFLRNLEVLLETYHLMPPSPACDTASFLSTPLVKNWGKLLVTLPAAALSLPIAAWFNKMVEHATHNPSPFIELSVAKPEHTWNLADIIIATPNDDTTTLMTTGKPLLWLGNSLPPTGTVCFNPTHETPVETAAVNPRTIPHFRSYQALIAHAKHLKSSRLAGGDPC